MTSEDPPFLLPGKEVSAKYRGAFCEARVKKVDKNVKCRVTLKDDGRVLQVTDEDVVGVLKVGATVQVKKPDSNQMLEGTLKWINDCSIYTVVFDDGDENTLRRSKLCLKGDRHFERSETLDHLPLTHPEHFGTPVVKKNAKSKAQSTATGSESDSDVESSDDDSETGKRTYSIHSQQNLVGRVLCVDFEERSRRTVNVPVLVVLPSADDVVLPSRQQVLVKSFKDGKFCTATISDMKEFTAEIVAKNKDKALKIAFDKAQIYLDRKELPQSWSKMDLLGYSSSESGESSDDDEPDEKKDRFVAELFKFMDDRGTPINKLPNLGGQDLNLFKLFRVVQSMGGYNRVTNQMKWHVVHSKTNLPSATVVSTNIKQAYKKYLHAYEDFDRKLGCTMVTSGHSRMSSRSLVSFRDRERDQTPKLGRNRRVGSVREEESEKAQLKAEPETDKLDKPIAAASSSKLVVVGGSSSSSSGPTPIKTRMPKRFSSKKDSGDSDSVSSDIIISPRLSVALPASTPSSSATKSSVESTRAQSAAAAASSARSAVKDSEKPSPPALRASSQASKEEPMRVTRGDSLKMKDPGPAKEERSEKPRMPTKGDAKDSGKVKADVEKPSEKIESVEKDEKHKGSRRMLRRNVHIPSAEEDAEDEAKSTNSDKGPWDEPSETNDSATNEDLKMEEDQLPRPLTGRRNTNYDDMYAVGTRLQVKYGKGKGQKIYEAKVLETAVQSGLVKYFVHYNGWNSRYDEWIHKDVIVNVLEEPVPEMPKLKSSIAPPVKSQITTVRKKTNPASASPTLSNKDDNRVPKSKVAPGGSGGGGSGPEATPSGGRRTRSNSVDQPKQTPKTPGRIRAPKMKTTETGSNSGDSNSSSSSSSSSSLSASSSETEEKDNNSSEPPTVERKPDDENIDEDLSNSSRSSSPAPSPEMPDIYTSEDEEEDSMKGDVPRLDDPESLERDEKFCDDLPVIERTILSDVSLAPSEPLSVAEIATDGTDASDRETTATTSVTALDGSCPTTTAEVSDESRMSATSTSSTKHENIVSESALALKCVSPLPTLVEESEGDLTSATTDDVAHVSQASRAETPKPDAEDETDKPVLPPTLVESSSSTAGLAKTRRRKKQLEKPLEIPGEVAAAGSKPLSDANVEETCDEPKTETVFEGPPAADVEKKRKRKLSTCVEPTGTSAAVMNATQNQSLETMAFEDVSEAEGAVEPVEEIKPKLLRRKDIIPVLVKELTTTPFTEKSSKKPRLLKTGAAQQSKDAPKDLECMQTSVAAAEPDIAAWKFDVKSDEVEDDDNKSAVQPDLEKEEETPGKDDEIMESSSFEAGYDCQPLNSSLDDEARISNEDANLLSEFAVECNKEALKNVFNDSPPASSENSPSAQDEATSPSQEEQTSTKSEQEANLEVEAYMGRRHETCDSQSGYDFSTASSDSTTSSSSSVRGFDNEGRPSSTSRKRKFDEEENNRTLHKKRRKDRHGDEDLEKNLSKPNYSSDLNDSDHDTSLPKLSRSTHGSSSPVKSSSHCPASSSSAHRQHPHHFHRPAKYNFIDLEEGKYLEGEDRISFLTNKIQDLRSAYMGLKAEVASIDRRRRRHRVKEKEMAQLSAVGSSSSTSAT